MNQPKHLGVESQLTTLDRRRSKELGVADARVIGKRRYNET